MKELLEDKEQFEDDLVRYAKQFEIDVVYGSNNKCAVKEIDKVVLPEDKGELIRALRAKGLWDDLSMINFMKFQSTAIKGNIDEEIKKMIEIIKDYRLSLSKRKDVEDE